MKHTLTAHGDLMMVGELRPYIGTEVEFVKRNKSGLIQVRAHDGTLLNVPQKNLDPKPVNSSAPGVTAGPVDEKPPE